MTNSAARLAAATPEEQKALQSAWWLILFLGLVSIVVGIVAIVTPFVTTLNSVLFIGWLLVVAGITETIHAVVVLNWRGFGLHLLAASLYLMAGVFILEDSIRAATVITLMLVAVFIVGGALRTFFSLVMRFPGWPWVTLNGAVDLLLGVLILNGWPESKLWAISLFVGIDLLFHGWSEVVLLMSIRKHFAAQLT